MLSPMPEAGHAEEALSTAKVTETPKVSEKNETKLPHLEVEAERKVVEDETSPPAKASEVSETKKAEVIPDEPSVSAQVCSE